MSGMSEEGCDVIKYRQSKEIEKDYHHPKSLCKLINSLTFFQIKPWAQDNKRQYNKVYKEHKSW